MRATPGDVLRSVVFYAAFYGGTVVYVIAAFLALIGGQSAFRCVVHRWSAFHRTCARHILGIRATVEGVLPKEGALVAMKHESFFEAIDLPNLLHLPAIFAKAELLRIPGWGSAGERYGLISVERDQGAKALRAMLSAARRFNGEGRLLVIFPEGTRIPHGSIAPLQSGFAGLYKLMKLPVVPVAVNSGPLYHRWWKRRGEVIYKVGEAIPPGLPRDEIERRVQDAINVLND